MENEKRLISLDYALEALNSEGITKNMRAHRKVAAIPTVDAVEVVHGRTIFAKEPQYIWIDRECENCHYLMLITDNYCPNCGAKMDGDGNA